MNKKVLFISTLHRSSERFFEAFKNIPGVEVTALNIGQTSQRSNYSANKNYLKRQSSVFSKIINGPGVNSSSETRSETFSKRVQKKILETMKIEEFNMVIIDDDRDDIKFIKNAYLTVKSFANIPFVSVREGVIIHDRYYSKNKRYFDYLMCVGNYDKEYFIKRDNIEKRKILEIGIPDNDKILNVEKTKGNYCLVILNYICKRPNKKFFDHNQKQVALNKRLIESLGLRQIQDIEDLEIFVKIKHRFGEDMNQAINHVKESFEGLKFKIITDTESDIELIKDARFVISYGSNMTIKSMVMNKPTVIIEGLGYLSFFNDYFNKYNTIKRESTVFNMLRSFDIVKNKDFLNKNIAGSTDFNSSDLFRTHILKILKDENG